jgi:hypothetical protein
MYASFFTYIKIILKEKVFWFTEIMANTGITEEFKRMFL